MAKPENSPNVCRNKPATYDQQLRALYSHTAGLHRSSVGTDGLRITAAVSTTNTHRITSLAI